jgi:hypothetical protein
MSDNQTTPASVPVDANPPTKEALVPAGEYVYSKEIEKLPPEMKTIVSVVAGIFRSTSGPDPETSRIVAQTEMHEESCKLEGYKESLKVRDKQSDRDHAFRVKKLNHDTAKSMSIIAVCVAGIACGLYLLVVRKDETLGSGLLIASFMALLSGGEIGSAKGQRLSSKLWIPRPRSRS